MKFVCLKYPKLEMTYKTEVVREVNGVIMKEPRKVIRFEGGYYETNDSDEIAFIKRHVDFGNGNICTDESKAIQKEAPEVKEEPKKKGRPKKVI